MAWWGAGWIYTCDAIVIPMTCSLHILCLVLVLSRSSYLSLISSVPPFNLLVRLLHVFVSFEVSLSWFLSRRGNSRFSYVPLHLLLPFPAPIQPTWCVSYVVPSFIIGSFFFSFPFSGAFSWVTSAAVWSPFYLVLQSVYHLCFVWSVW